MWVYVCGYIENLHILKNVYQITERRFSSPGSINTPLQFYWWCDDCFKVVRVIPYNANADRSPYCSFMRRHIKGSQQDIWTVDISSPHPTHGSLLRKREGSMREKERKGKKERRRLSLISSMPVYLLRYELGMNRSAGVWPWLLRHCVSNGKAEREGVS